MPRKPIACPSCGALVSNGRLSCPACGTLVATVSSGPKPATSSIPPVLADPAPPPAATHDATPVAPPPARAAKPALRRSAPPAAKIAPRPPEPAPGPAARIPWYAAQAPKPEPAATPTIEPTASTPMSPRSGSVLRQVEARRAVAWTNDPTEEYDAPAPAEAPPASPGAYLAPSAAFSAPLLKPRAGGLAEVHTATRASAPGYSTSATGAVSAVAFAPAFGGAVSEAPAAAATAKRSVTMQAPTELPGWLAIAGSAIGAVSFLMPWSRDGVIGATGSTYFDRWGLANVGYLPLVVAALLLLAVNGVPNPIPTWIRAGLAPLTIGAILFGLDWAYQTRPYSDGLGVTLLLVGALVLMVGGLIGVRSGRHPAVPPAV